MRLLTPLVSVKPRWLSVQPPRGSIAFGNSCSWNSETLQVSRTDSATKSRKYHNNAEEVSVTAGSHSIRMPALRAAATLHRDQSVRDRLAAGRDMHGRKAIVNISVATRTLFNQLREKEGREKGKMKKKGRRGSYEWSLGSCESCTMKGCVKDAKKEEYWPPKV